MTDVVNVGTSENDHTGDAARTAFTKINAKHTAQDAAISAVGTDLSTLAGVVTGMGESLNSSISEQAALVAAHATILAIVQDEFESIAALQALTAQSTCSVAHVKAYRTGSGKGGGTFWYDSTCSDADDGFLVIVSADFRRWRRMITVAGVDAYMAGAYGDGVVSFLGVVSAGHDDTAALNKIFSYLRDEPNAHTGMISIKASIGVGVFRCNGSVSAAGIKSRRFALDGTGSTIASQAEGLPALDFGDSDGAYVQHINVTGDPNARPAVGIFLCRTQSSGDFHFMRPRVSGNFTYAAFHNSIAENVTVTQPLFINKYRGDCYAMAQDALGYLRYDPPKFAGSGLTIHGEVLLRFFYADHGLVDGDQIYAVDVGGVTAANGRRYTISKVDDDNFTIPVDGTGYTSGGRYFKARYFPDPTYVNQADDVLEPYAGDGAFTLVVEGGQAQCPYGIAGILDTQGGRRRINMRSACSLHLDNTTLDIAIATVTGAGDLIDTGSNHGFLVGDLVWTEGTDQPDTYDGKLWKVATVPGLDSLTVTYVDDQDPVTVDATGGTIHKVVDRGGYAVHWMLDTKIVNARYEAIHHEAIGIDDCGTKALGLVSSVVPLREGTAPERVYIQAIRFTEHNVHGSYGCFVADETTVSDVIMTGNLCLNAAASMGDQGGPAGKCFVPPALWTFRGEIYTDEPDILSPDVTFNGTVINTRAGSPAFYLAPGGQTITDKTADYTILASQSGQSFTNFGATGPVKFTLPDAGESTGQSYNITAVVAQVITLQLVGSDTISLGMTSSAAGTLVSDGSALTSVNIRAANNRRWLVESGHRTDAWTIPP